MIVLPILWAKCNSKHSDVQPVSGLKIFHVILRGFFSSSESSKTYCWRRYPPPSETCVGVLLCQGINVSPSSWTSLSKPIPQRLRILTEKPQPLSPERSKSGMLVSYLPWSEKEEFLPLSASKTFYSIPKAYDYILSLLGSERIFKYSTISAW